MKFNEVIEKAEEYLKKEAQPIIEKIREKKYGSIEEMLEPYKPNCTIEELEKMKEFDFKKTLLDRFCEQLQNYQAMPRAINYKANKRKILKKLESANNKDALMQELGVDNNNFAWEKYAQGIIEAKKYINKTNFKENFLTSLKIINGASEFKTKLYEINKIKKIYGIGDALKYDFFKELCCDNLCKPDVHIVDICKEIEGFNFSTENPKKDEIAEKFIELCDKKNVYYCDKILWLCCTGNFYKDEIIITRISKEAFFNFLMSN